jgi:hypothetical protein
MNTSSLGGTQCQFLLSRQDGRPTAKKPVSAAEISDGDVSMRELGGSTACALEFLIEHWPDVNEVATSNSTDRLRNVSHQIDGRLSPIVGVRDCIKGDQGCDE